MLRHWRKLDFVVARRDGNVERRGRRDSAEGGAVPMVRGNRSKIGHPVGDERAENEREIRERAAE